VINAYLTLLVKKFNDKNTERAFVIDSFEMTNIWQQKKPKIRIDPCLYKYLIGIVNQSHHWMLVVKFHDLMNSVVHSRSLKIALPRLSPGLTWMCMYRL
ncbi:hypothetical protein GOODEAATRI_034340, partial [Goodea atripinnis]